jgi:hypothetical protein
MPPACLVRSALYRSRPVAAPSRRRAPAQHSAHSPVERSHAKAAASTLESTRVARVPSGLLGCSPGAVAAQAVLMGRGYPISAGHHAQMLQCPPRPNPPVASAPTHTISRRTQPHSLSRPCLGIGHSTSTASMAAPPRSRVGSKRSASPGVRQSQLHVVVVVVVAVVVAVVVVVVFVALLSTSVHGDAFQGAGRPRAQSCLRASTGAPGRRPPRR